MKPVEFTVTDTDCNADRYHYACSEYGDNSGLFWPDALVHALVKAMDKLLYKVPIRDSYLKEYKDYKAALAPFVEDKK